MKKAFAPNIVLDRSIHLYIPGPDLKADDGVYSTEFGRFVVNTAGRYSVRIDVDNPDNTGKIAKHTNAGSRSPKRVHGILLFSI